MFGQLGADCVHRLVEIDIDDAAAEVLGIDVGHEAGRIGFELFEKDAVLGDLAQRLAVG